MDSDLISIQNDLIEQKTILDKQIKSLNTILEKEIGDKFELEPILKNMIKKLNALDIDKKEENVSLIKKLKALREKTESIQPFLVQYRIKLKEFSDSKINNYTVKEFLPATQQFMDSIKKDIEEILKD
jgi:hypothetical protein